MLSINNILNRITPHSIIETVRANTPLLAALAAISGITYYFMKREEALNGRLNQLQQDHQNALTQLRTDVTSQIRTANDTLSKTMNQNLNQLQTQFTDANQVAVSRSNDRLSAIENAQTSASRSISNIESAMLRLDQQRSQLAQQTNLKIENLRRDLAQKINLCETSLLSLLKQNTSSQTQRIDSLKETLTSKIAKLCQIRQKLINIVSSLDGFKQAQHQKLSEQSAFLRNQSNRIREHLTDFQSNLDQTLGFQNNTANLLNQQGDKISQMEVEIANLTHQVEDNPSVVGEYLKLSERQTSQIERIQQETQRQQKLQIKTTACMLYFFNRMGSYYLNQANRPPHSLPIPNSRLQLTSPITQETIIKSNI